MKGLYKNLLTLLDMHTKYYIRKNVNKLIKFVEKILEPEKIFSGSSFKLKIKMIKGVTYNEAKEMTYNQLKTFKYKELKGDE